MDHDPLPCTPCGVRTFRRNTYFNGKLLVERDFRDEQHYLIGKDWLHNSLLHGTGTVCGLLVRAHPNEECRRRHVVVEPGVRTGVPVLMDNPREVGSDRIINALAAAQLYDGPSIVVDFGTATTFDVVSAKGEYVGGAIAPGIDISLEALGRRGAQLRKVELLRPRSVIAKNTVEALQSGVLYGFASQVDGIVTRMVGELGLLRQDVNVVATGGLAPLVVEECACFTDHQPWLTLLGLAFVWRRNA